MSHYSDLDYDSLRENLITTIKVAVQQWREQGRHVPGPMRTLRGSADVHPALVEDVVKRLKRQRIWRRCQDDLAVAALAEILCDVLRDEREIVRLQRTPAEVAESLTPKRGCFWIGLAGGMMTPVSSKRVEWEVAKVLWIWQESRFQPADAPAIKFLNTHTPGLSRLDHGALMKFLAGLAALGVLKQTRCSTGRRLVKAYRPADLCRVEWIEGGRAESSRVESGSAL